MGKKFHHLTRDDRLKIEVLLKADHKPQEIADIIGVHVSTIYREKNRGKYEHTLTDLTTEIRYSPDIAEEKYRQQLKNKGAELKIGNDYELANYIEERIINGKLTPLAVLGEIKAKNLQFKTSICVNTLYSYIYKGIFLNLTMKYLPVKPRKKNNKNHKLKVVRPPKGLSIENRPGEVNSRQTFGNWEMDCVIGKREKSSCLLVLTERLTRYEILIKMKEHTSACVVKSLDMLQRKYGTQFPRLFRTITVDNGSEFMDSVGIEKSVYKKDKKRTTVYYCHPYSSSERGSNERLNREIRRNFPKGTNFDRVSDVEVENCENWINDYPRQILNFSSSKCLFESYFANL